MVGEQAAAATFAAATAEVAAAAAAKLNAYNGLHNIHTTTKGRFDITTSQRHT